MRLKMHVCLYCWLFLQLESFAFCCAARRSVLAWKGSEMSRASDVSQDRGNRPLPLPMNIRYHNAFLVSMRHGGAQNPPYGVRKGG